MSRSLVILGDSIFDNGLYVQSGEPDVRAQLEAKLDGRWTVDFRAVDGAVAGDIASQLAAREIDMPCCFVLSVGGNDALGFVGLLEDYVTTMTYAALLNEFADIRENFRASYVGALDAILRHGQPTVVCTIYNPAFPDPTFQRLAETGLSFFNDVISEEALARGVDIIDLRRVCAERAAFANPVEPSAYGGNLIADAILAKVGKYAS